MAERTYHAAQSTDTSVRRKVGARRGHKVNAMSFAILCKLMMDGTRTCQELADDTGLHKLTIYDWTRELHRQGVIHICMWEGEGRASTRIFKFGPGKDAPRPIKPRSQSYAEYKARRAAMKLNQRMAGGIQCTPHPLAKSHLSAEFAQPGAPVVNLVLTDGTDNQ